MNLVSAEAEIRHVFGDTPITEASIGAAPPDILVKLSGSNISEVSHMTRTMLKYLTLSNHTGYITAVQTTS